MILTFHDVVQPDLVVVTDAQQISQRGIEGPSTLVIEVLSPSTRQTDLTVKARRYAALGIRHYWIVDPEARRVACYRDEGGIYVQVVAAEGDASISHPDWPGLTIVLGELWA